ncbi:ADP-ribosylation factor-like protein 13B [Thrips palmi]|uniref:ADP-ribosylation factor-like protein 13B n=1 Tax=Thrips palmi TaxID=161013 RepID=A0A6P8ZB84_THRPL|nr:ADP-ribosylation factor-like protein 13B [Thrips palmi]
MGNCCAQVKLVRNRVTIRRRRKIVLLLVGLDNSGKTATAKGLLKENMHSTVPTVGFSSYNLFYKGYTVVIYDLGGGPQIRDIWSQYYVDVHGIIYVIDASDTSRINESCSVLQRLLTHDKLKGKPLLLLANKQDVDGALDEIDVVERLNLEAIVNEQKCPTLVETCCAVPPPSDSKLRKAYQDPGIQNGYRWILNIIIKDYNALNSRVEMDSKIAQDELMVEKENRRKRVEEERRKREEIESTVIIPLRDSSPESCKSRIITVQSSSEGIGTAQEPISEEAAHPSDSQDSGCTDQNGFVEADANSLNTIKSTDSAVKFDDKIEATENTKEKKHFLKKNFMKRTNRTAPANVPHDETKGSGSQPAARHRLPPLTPPPNHVKMFEVKSSKRSRLVTSMSLSFDKSESELTDEDRSLNLVSFPSDWKLLKQSKGHEDGLNGSNNEDSFGKTFVVSSGAPTLVKK